MAAMLMAAILPAGASAALSSSGITVAQNQVTNITAGQCVPTGGISGTVTVTVVDAPFVFDIYVTDHIPGESDFVEVPGSRVTLSFDESGTYEYGPLNANAHRDGVNTLRVESTGGTAKSPSIPLCPVETPTPTPTPEVTPTPTPEVTPTPTPEVTPTPTPEVTPTPTPEVTPTPTPTPLPTESTQPTPTPTPEVTPTPTPLPTESTQPTPTPTRTLPPTDALSGQAHPASDSWRLALIAIAGILAAVMVLTPARRRR